MLRAVAIWGVLGLALTVPVSLALNSPQLAWREPIYIVAGLAGILAMALMPVQPLAIIEAIPNLDPRGARRLHRWIGVAILIAVVAHVAGLWLTSPPDVIDAFLFRSPTPFAPWGVAAMWAVLGSGLVGAMRLKGRVRWKTWRLIHGILAVIMVVGTVVHVILIEGTMEPVSKIALSAFLLIAGFSVVLYGRA